MKDGKCIIVSAPSGAGKTTIVHHLLDQDLGLEFSISACTRIKRHNEEDGVDYHFMSPGYFREQIEKDAFLEWEEVYPGQYYGTLRNEIQRIWDQGKTVIFDVDVEGGLNLKKIFGDQGLAIFVMAPSIEALKVRLTSRRTESEEKLALRMEKAEQEMEKASEFDQVVMNDELTQAMKDTEQLVRDFLKD